MQKHRSKYEEGKQRSRCSVLVDEFYAGGFSINSYDVPEPRRVRNWARLSVIARENLPELNTEEIILDYIPKMQKQSHKQLVISLLNARTLRRIRCVGDAYFFRKRLVAWPSEFPASQWANR